MATTTRIPIPDGSAMIYDLDYSALLIAVASTEDEAYDLLDEMRHDPDNVHCIAIRVA